MTETREKNCPVLTQRLSLQKKFAPNSVSGLRAHGVYEVHDDLLAFLSRQETGDVLIFPNCKRIIATELLESSAVFRADTLP